jgi:transposase-like protein
VVRSSQYLNNLIEQDHRGVKSRTRPMLGFKNFKSAAICGFRSKWSGDSTGSGPGFCLKWSAIPL